MPETTLSDAQVQKLLAGRDIAVLATIQPSGAPLAMAMWFIHDERTITMISVDGLQKVRNVRRDPRVSVAVEAVEDGALRCASVQGHVEFVDDPDERRPLVEQLFTKYSASLEGRWEGRSMPQDRVMFRIIPDKVFYWGYAT